VISSAVLDKLRRILPPPASPHEAIADPHRWLAVFEELGSRLPEDYIQLIKAYGTGQVNGFLTVYNPFAANRYVNLLRQVPQELSVLRTIKWQAPETVPYPLWFEPRGLLPWGRTDNGEVLCWATDGGPPPAGGTELVDSWTIVVIGGRNPEHQAFSTSLEEFLVDVLTRRGHCSLFPDIADEPARFSVTAR